MTMQKRCNESQTNVDIVQVAHHEVEKMVGYTNDAGLSKDKRETIFVGVFHLDLPQKLLNLERTRNNQDIPLKLKDNQSEANQIKTSTNLAFGRDNTQFNRGILPETRTMEFFSKWVLTGGKDSFGPDSFPSDSETKTKFEVHIIQ